MAGRQFVKRGQEAYNSVMFRFLNDKAQTGKKNPPTENNEWASISDSPFATSVKLII